MAISSTYHIAAMLAIVASTAFIVTSLATHQWMKGCFSLAKMVDFVHSTIASAANITVDAVSQALPMGNHQMCLYQGLFASTLTYQNLYTIQLPLDFSQSETFVKVTVVILALAVACGVVCVALLIAASATINQTYEKKNAAISKTRIAVLFTILASLISLVGMSVYSGFTRKMINDPVELVSHIDKAIMQSLSAMEQEILPPGVIEPGRGKRQVPDMSNFDMMMLFDGMIPKYDYSFVFGWVGFVGFVVSVVMVFWAHRNMTSQPQNNTEDKL